VCACVYVCVCVCEPVRLSACMQLCAWVGGCLCVFVRVCLCGITFRGYYRPLTGLLKCVESLFVVSADLTHRAILKASIQGCPRPMQCSLTSYKRSSVLFSSSVPSLLVFVGPFVKYDGAQQCHPLSPLLHHLSNMWCTTLSYPPSLPYTVCRICGAQHCHPLCTHTHTHTHTYTHSHTHTRTHTYTHTSFSAAYTYTHTHTSFPSTHTYTHTHTHTHTHTSQQGSDQLVLYTALNIAEEGDSEHTDPGQEEGAVHRRACDRDAEDIEAGLYLY